MGSQRKGVAVEMLVKVGLMVVAVLTIVLVIGDALPI